MSKQLKNTIKALAAVLEQNRSLQILRLYQKPSNFNHGSPQLGIDVGKAFAESLGKNQTLQKLVLRGFMNDHQAIDAQRELKRHVCW